MARYDNFGNLDAQFVDEADVAFSRINARLRPDQLKPSELAVSENGRMDVDGAWQVRRGVDSFGPIIGSSGSLLTLPFTFGAQVTISTASRSNATVTIVTSSAHGFETGYTVGIVALTGGTVDPNGNRVITKVDSTTFTFTITGATGSDTYTVSGSSKAGGAILSTSLNRAFGSCLYSDPKDDNEEYIILVQSNKAVAINRITELATDIAFPTGQEISYEVDVVQAFNNVYIFRDGQTAWKWNGSFSGTPAFSKVANGDYAASVYFDASNNTVVADGIVTVTATSHGMSVGTQIYVVDNGTTLLVENGGGYQIYAVTSNTFKFYANVPDSAATTVVFAKRASQGLGFSHMPAPAWGVYHQRRLIVPYFYNTTGTSGSEVIVDRQVRDEILISDIFDGDTYDRIQNQLKVTAGIADYLQFVHPFTEDNAVVFNRNSIHLLSGLSGSLGDMSLKEITREAGLVARKSVVTIGNQIFFLSDNGVYATEFGDLYNLRGAGLPLSDAIDPIIKRINRDYAQNSVAIYHNNRYWLAVPLDNSEYNNYILVYNLLNKGWESIDLINNTGWNVTNFIVSGAGSINKLFAVNFFGGIHVIDERDDGFDYVYTGPGLTAEPFYIESRALTRQYSFNTPDRKKFNTFEVHVESSDFEASDGDLSVVTENLDEAADVGTINSILGEDLAVAEDSSLRGRIGNLRAYGLQMQFAPTKGRPKLRMVKVTATPTFRSTTQAS